MFVVKHKLSSAQEYCVFTRDFKQLSSRVFFALTDKLFNRSVTFRETHFNFSPVLFSTSLLDYARRGRANFFNICTITNNFNQSYIRDMYSAYNGQWSQIPWFDTFSTIFPILTSLAIITIPHIKIQPYKITRVVSEKRKNNEYRHLERRS